MAVGLAARLLFILLYILLVSQCIEEKIYWERCGTHSECFVRESCIEGKQDKDKLVRYKGETLKEDKNCDFIMQMRYYTQAKYRIYMQVNVNATELTIDEPTGVKLTHQTAIFTCKKSGLEVEKAIFKIVEKGIHKFDPKIVFCSFIVETVDSTEAVSYYFRKHDNDYPIVEFKLGDKLNQLKYAAPNNQLWMPLASEMCSPEAITSEDVSNEDFIQKMTDKYAFSPIQCEDNTKSLIITRKNMKPIFLKANEKLYCESRVSWTYNQIPKPINIPANEEFTIGCGEQFCTKCEKLDYECPGCTTPIHADKDGCKTVKCPEGYQWRLEGKENPTSGEMECKKDGSTGAWYHKDSAEKVTKAACFDQRVCWDPAGLKETCPTDLPSDRECSSSAVTKSDNNSVLTCPGSKLGYGAGFSTDRMECNFTSKKYKTDVTAEIEPGTNVYCFTTKPATTTAGPAAASVQMEVIIGGGLGGLIVIIIIIAIVIVVVKKKAKGKKHDGPRTIDLGEGSAELPSRVDNPDSVSKSLQSIKPTPPYVPPPNSTLERLPEVPRTPWSARQWTGEVQELPFDKEMFSRFTEDSYAKEILPHFGYFSSNKMRISFYMLTGLYPYIVEKDRKPGSEAEERKPYGDLRHFWDLFRHCEASQIDKLWLWERIWRYVRLLQLVVKKKFPKDPKSFGNRMQTIMVNFARPLFNELGWKKKPNEHTADTNMRFFCVRVLLWAGKSDVADELRRQASLPFEQLESPLRAVALAYAVRHMGKAAQIKADYWQRAMDDPLDPANDQFGTFRQHVIYALAMTPRDAKAKRGSNAEFQTLSEVLAPIADYSSPATCYTPTDSYWACLGAAEYDDTAAAAIKFMIAYWTKAPFTPEAFEPRLKAKSSGKSAAEVAKMRRSWNWALADMYDLLMDCCPDKATYYSLHPTIWDVMNNIFGNNPEIDHMTLFIEDRLVNMEAMCKRKDLENIFDMSLKRIEEP